MDKMKATIKHRISYLQAALVCLILVSAYDNIGPGFPITDAVSTHILDFQHGLRVGSMFALIGFIFYYISMLRSEQKLKKLYYELKDERMEAVRAKSGAPVLLGCAIALFAASMAFMYVSSVVSVTLIGCAIFLLLVAIVRKLFWTKKLSGNE